MKRTLLLVCSVFWLVLLLPAHAGAEDALAIPVKFRIEWGESVPRHWGAQFDLTGCELLSVKSLGVDADEAAVLKTAGQVIRYQPHSRRVFNSVEFMVRGVADAKLQIQVQDRDDPLVSLKQQFDLKDILVQKAIVPVNQTAAQLIVQQSPGDSFALRIRHPHLVFKPEEEIRVQAFPHFLFNEAVTPGKELNWNIQRARTGESVAAGVLALPTLDRAELLKQGVSLAVKAPAKGEYDLVVTMGGRQAVVQFAVLSQSRPRPHIKALIPDDGILVDELSLHGALDHRDLIKRRPGSRFRNSLKSFFNSHPAGEQSGQQSLPWSACHLRVKNLHCPHKLLVTYPRRAGAKLGFSILEPDAAGQLVPVGIDSGVYQADTEVTVKDRSEGLQAEILFWPKVDNPILLFHSLGSADPAQATRVEVYELPAQLYSQSVSQHEVSSGKEKSRLTGPYLQKPLLPEIFGATQVLDSKSNRSLDDWQTFREAGERLVYYLKYHRFNSALMAVSADGSTIYPSGFLAPTPRYDSGVYHSSGQDVVRKDVLELLFQMFNREQLTLVPELQFSSMLYSLELMLQDESDRSAGIELVNSTGQTWREAKGTSRGQAPFYNPLDPRVQAEIVKIFRELVIRYKQHPSFQGVAVQLSLNGYLQLPGLEWGYDDQTVQQFQKETGIKIPFSTEVNKYQDRFRYLTTTALPQWTLWRCQKIRELHQLLADVLQAESPDAQIVFSARELLPSRSHEGDVITALKAGTMFRPILMELGLDFSHYDQIENAVVLRPGQYDSQQQVSSLIRVLNTHPSVDDAFKSRLSGALFYHNPVEIRIAEFDRISPWQPAFTWLVSQVTPAEESNRIRYIHSIARQDPYFIFDGGWTIPFGQERATESIRSQFQQLPPRPFQTVHAASQPVITRLSRGKEKAFFYVVNDFPYQCEVSIEMLVPSKAPVIHLKSGEALTAIQSGGGVRRYTVTLEPFDFQAFRIDDSQIQIETVRCNIAEQDRKHLQAKIEQKKQSLVQLHQSMDELTAVVFHADFESKSSRDYILAGWESKVSQGNAWTIDSTESHSGKTSLVLGSAPGNNFLRTNEIPLQDSRYLNMSVWMKSTASDMRVRIALEAEQNGKLKVQSAIISVDQQWRKYLFRVKDIPADQIRNAHIVVEKLGAEKLWIDDVDLQIHQISPEDDRQLTKLVSTLSLAWDSQRYLDCYRLLTSYWGQFGETVEPSAIPAGEQNPVKHAERRGIRKLLQR
ncbi:family 10 glycosylhydrolase [Gimesia sp.]|uniref:family 10 glycosylhydrolase n=1 Tax=Gimesia sp. TaxID=2024833 RepID=UPI003A925276